MAAAQNAVNAFSWVTEFLSITSESEGGRKGESFANPATTIYTLIEVALRRGGFPLALDCSSATI